MTALRPSTDPKVIEQTDPKVMTGSRGERYGVAGSCLLQAALVAWAGWVLPWRSWTLFSLACFALALSGVVTAGLCLLGHPSSWRAWRASSWLSLLVLAIASWIASTSALYLVGVYGQLGAGLSAALIAVWALVVLVTLPLALWGLVRTRGAAARRTRWRWRPAALALLLFGGSWLLFSYRVHARAQGAPAPSADDAALLIAAQAALETRPAPRRPQRLRAKPLARCESAVDEHRLTLLISYLDAATQRPAATCLQAPDSATLVRRFTHHLKTRAARSYVKLDLITRAAVLDDVPRLVHPLALRPGLDGVCWGARCAAPWQLLARGALVSFRPLPFLRDLRLGVSFDALRAWFGVEDAPAPPPRRIATRSYSVDPKGNINQLRRMRPTPAPLTRNALDQSLGWFEQHVLDAQAKNGTFRYTLDPFTGKAERRHFNLARQAGTVLVLCELGSDTPRVTRTIERALAVFERHQRPLDEATAGLSRSASARRLRLASAALPLAALLRCRDRAGARFDPLIAKLSRFILKLQQPNGNFFPEFDLQRGAPRRAEHPLFAPGQAILAFILLDDHYEQLRGWLEPAPGAPQASARVSREQVRAALRRAMDYVADEHWRVAASSFFFIEENWHCLAAREALQRHRHAGYEQFCLDYMRFKRRHILEPSSRVAEEFIGGFGFGNVVPPHNTGTAGFAEAMAAAIAVKRARHQEIDDDVALLRRAVAFLVRQQWSPSHCFACVPEAVGAISEHTHSPLTRIDFVQHAWAGVGHSLPWLN